MQRNTIYAVSATILIVVGWLAFRQQAAHSDAFQFVRDDIRRSAVIRQRIGTVKEVRLPLWGMYRAHYSTLESRVDMTVEAIGTNGSVLIDVQVTKADGPYKLEKSTINGVPVRLM
jgi:hypothetical protein